jgi:N-acetylglucosamine malate deacetylase 1
VAPVVSRPSAGLMVRRLIVRAVVRALNRLRPIAPPTLWFTLSALVSAAGKGPVVTRPWADRVLVLAPHPDDETIGCGGCIALLAASGADVRVLSLSSGENLLSGVAPVEAEPFDRVAELERACTILGATLAGALTLPDGELGRHQPAVTSAVDTLIRAFRPEIIFVPWLLDDHPDHRALSQAVAACPGLTDTSEIWCYEVWAALPPNRIVDVSPWWEKKQAALASHESGFRSFDLSAHLALGRWRAIAGLSGHGFAEAYLVLSPTHFRDLAKGTQ